MSPDGVFLNTLDDEPDDWVRAVIEGGPPEPDPGRAVHLWGAAAVVDRECHGSHQQLRLTGNDTDYCDECWADARDAERMAAMEAS